MFTKAVGGRILFMELEVASLEVDLLERGGWRGEVQPQRAPQSNLARQRGKEGAR